MNESKELHATTAQQMLPLHVLNAQAPGLAVVLVGNRKDSETYVRSKKKMSVEVGIESFGTELPAEATEEEILKVRGYWSPTDQSLRARWKGHKQCRDMGSCYLRRSGMSMTLVTLVRAGF